MLSPLEPKDAGYDYKLFGLVFHSNLLLPGIPQEENSAGTQHLALHLGVLPYAKPETQLISEELTYVSSDTNDRGEPLLQIWNVNPGSFVRMAYEDGTQFWLDGLRENIWATWPDHLPLENTTSYLLGPVLGLLLRLRGVVCLHASAVEIEGQAVAFVGSPGAGKSTAAAAFSKMGYAVLSDDIAALEEREGLFYLVPAYPQLRLWPESVEMIYGRAEALPPFNPEWDKRGLGPGDQGVRFENRACPLGAVYILSDRRPAPAPYVQPLRSQGALLSLVADTYANKILDRDMRAREFEVLGRLAACVPIRRLFPPSDPDRLQALCRVIETDVASLRTPARRPA